VFVHLNDLAPVGSNLRQVQALAQVDQVQDILLETRSTKTNTGLEEFRPNAGVIPNGVGDFVNVCPSGFANGGKSIDGGDTLGEHRVRGELGEFRGPEADSEDSLLAKDREIVSLIIIGSIIIELILTGPSWRRYP